MNDNTFEFIQFIYNKNDQFKNQLYTRGSIVIGIYVFILPGLITVIDKYPELTQRMQILDYFFIVSLGFSLLFTIISIYFGIKSIQPFEWLSRLRKINLARNNAERKDKNDIHPKSTTDILNKPLTAFPYIVEWTYDDYCLKIMGLDQNQINAEMLKGLYNLCLINNDRYIALKKSYTFLFRTLISFLIVIFIWLMKKYGI